jgi:outer membrane protein TolC
VGHNNKFIKLVGVSTAIALTNITASVAQAPNVSAQQSAQESAQESDEKDTTIEQVKPAQPAVSDSALQKLDPSGNPLSFPTKPAEVQLNPQQAITLQQALQLSLKNNKDIQEARRRVEQDEAALREAKAALYPTFDVTSGLTYGSDLFLDSTTQQRIDQTAEDFQAQDPNLSEEQARQNAEEQFSGVSSSSFQFQGGLGINYDIYNGGERGASIRAAEKQLRSTELNLEVTVEEARLETSTNYYNLQNRDAQVEIQQAAVKDANQTLRDAQLLQKAGLGTKFEVLQAEVELSRARQDLITAFANQNIARRELAQTLSVSHKADLATADKIQEAGAWNLDLPQTIIQAFKNRAELEQLLLQREINKEQRTIALSRTRPNLSANADYTLNDDFEADDFDITDQYQVGLNLQWQLFDGGAARARAEQADKDREIAETRFANQRNQIRFDVEQAFFQLRSNKTNIANNTKRVDVSTESLRLARLRFQSGVGTQTEVIDAQTALTRARGDLLDSIIDYNLSFAELTRQVSNTPDNGLQDLP